jgi:putative ABC transport system permease protein
MSGEDDQRRRTRWAGLVGFSSTRLWKQATRTTTGRIVATTSAVALTIAFLLVVTGVALALADGGVVSQNDADVRVTPGKSGTLSGVDGVEPARLGAANERAREISAHDGVDHASPVLVEPVRMETADGDQSRLVLLVGVVPDEDPRTVAGLSTAPLGAGDPHYADGGYDGPARRDIVLSTSAAERLGASTGDELTVESAADGSSPTVTATAVEDAAAEDSDAGAPVALVSLSELQTLSRASDGELADRVLVWGDDGAAESAATEAYPDATVESGGSVDPAVLFDDSLAFATSMIALVVGVAICASFVATTMGMTVNEDRQMLAVLEAIGFPTRSRLAVVAVSTQITTLCGALLGIVLGVLALLGVNALARATVASGDVAAFHPVFVPYAVGVAFLAGLIAVPYPLAVAARTTVLKEVGQ